MLIFFIGVFVGVVMTLLILYAIIIANNDNSPGNEGTGSIWHG